MYRPNDPRFRRRLNEISHTLESANETAQARVFVFGQEYVSPCLAGLASFFQPCAEHCFPNRDQRHRRGPRRSRGRAELNFDFYDDWAEDEDDALLGWGDDEYDGFGPGAGGYGAVETAQPAKQHGMNYGARRDGKSRRPGEAGADSAVQGSSYFGFFRGLTDKLGAGRSLRYKPSAAGLQENPGTSKRYYDEEGEPLVTDESDGDAIGKRKKHGRKRSGTVGSEQTLDSFSSRGDLFPSEDEDDAVPLDDEFAMVLERRTTSSGNEDGSSGTGMGADGKRPSLGSRKSTRTRSSRGKPKSNASSRAASQASPGIQENLEPETVIIATLNELKQEEERARIEEETAIAKKRRSAQELAAQRGLQTQDADEDSHPGHSISSTPSRPAASVPDDFGDFQQSPAISDNASAHGEEMAFSPARLPRFS